nr:hypothetical protein [Tanacetum cinerariifolium]
MKTKNKGIKRKISSEDDIECHSFGVPNKLNVRNLTAIDITPNVSGRYEPSPDIGQSSVALIHSHDPDDCAVYNIKTKNKAVKKKISFEDDIEGHSFGLPKKLNVGNLTATDVAPSISHIHEPSPDVGQSLVALVHSHESDHCETNACLQQYQCQPPSASDSQTRSNVLNIMITRNTQHLLQLLSDITIHVHSPISNVVLIVVDEGQ